jgi:hypothetical protein
MGRSQLLRRNRRRGRNSLADSLSERGAPVVWFIPKAYPNGHRPHLPGVEIDQLYIAIRRWRRVTGERAVHAENGVDFAALELEETGGAP